MADNVPDGKVTVNIGQTTHLNADGQSVRTPIMMAEAKGRASDGKDIGMMLSQTTGINDSIKQQVTAIFRENGHEFWVRADPENPRTVEITEDIMQKNKKTVSINNPVLAGRLSGIAVDSMSGNSGHQVEQHNFDDFAKNARAALQEARIDSAPAPVRTR